MCLFNFSSIYLCIFILVHYPLGQIKMQKDNQAASLLPAAGLSKEVCPPPAAPQIHSLPRTLGTYIVHNSYCKIHQFPVFLDNISAKCNYSFYFHFKCKNCQIIYIPCL